MVGLSPGFVCSGQNWLVYLQFLYVMDNSGWYIALICLSRTIMVGISPCLFCHDINGLFISLFCLPWTISVGISSGFVCLGQ